jgi:hypothetical protein
MKIFSIPLNPKLSPEEFDRFYKLVETYKDHIYDIYFTTRIPPFINDAMGDVFDPQQSVDIMENSFILQDTLGIPLSATFNNIEVPPTMEFLDMWIVNFKPLYDRGIRTVTLPHTIWMLSGKIQKAYPDLFVKNTILRNVQRANELVKLVEAGFSYINLDRDLMRDHNALREIKKAKEYCIQKFGRDIKVSLLANEGCWGNCSVQDEHFQFNNTRPSVKAPTYFMTQLSKVSCPQWDRDDPGHVLKKADFPPWREDWLEFINELGIDVIKMHGREHAPRLFETMQIIENFANGKETVWNTFDSYVEEMKIDGSPINVWRQKIKTCKFDCWDCNYCNKVVASKSSHRYVDQIRLSLNNADAGKSKLTQEVLDIPGLTSHKVKHFINNLADMVDTRYLEIGAFQGAVFASAIQGNQIAAVAVDNFSTPEIEPMREVEGWVSTPGPTKATLNKNIHSTGFKGAKVLDKDFLEVTQDDLPFKTSILFYDGDHSLEAHVNAIKHYYDLCDEVFILVVDDWNWQQAQEGTRQGIKETGLKIKYENAILTQGEDPNDYWNGLGIFVLAKN